MLTFEANLKVTDVAERIHGAVATALGDVAEMARGRMERELANQGVWDRGTLAKSLSVDRSRIDELIVRVWTNAPHAAPIEYGAGPSGETPTSKFMPPEEPIRGWCQRKLGLRGKELDRATGAIRWHIYNTGLRPRPFMRPAANWAETQLRTVMGDELERIPTRMREAH